jgi:hypothetical protein
MMTIDPMTKCRQILLGYLIGTIIFGFAACTDEVGGKALSGSGSITFTVGGIAEGGAETLTRAQLEPQTLRQDLGDGLSMVYTLSIDPASLTRTSSNMGTGTKYRVIAYKKNGSNYDYVKEKVFEAGTSGSLDGLETAVYKIVALSYNSATVPPEAGSSATTITVDPENDLLHYVSGDIDLSSGTGSVGAITFNHCFTKLTVAVDASQTGNNVKSITSATLDQGYKGKLTLLDATLEKDGSSDPQTITAFNVNSTTATSTPRHVFSSTDNPVTVTFSDLTVAAPSGDKTISPTIDFTTSLSPGYSYTLKMRIEASKGDYYVAYGADVDPDVDVVIPLGSKHKYNGGSITFLRYNLGADPSMSPKEQMKYLHTDDKNIRVYGGLYQWGRSDKEHSLRDTKTTTNESIYFQTAPYSTYDGTQTKFVYNSSLTYSWWLSSDIAASTMWGNGTTVSSQSDTSLPNMTGYNTYNPCPSGYRVPTQYEWAIITCDGANGDPTPTDYKKDVMNVGCDDPNNFFYDYGDTWTITLSNQSIVWVQVGDGKAVNGYSNLWPSITSGSKMNGYALYKLADLPVGWDNPSTGAFAENKDLTSDTAPEPLMFLPAAGRRLSTSAAMNSVGLGGYYWTCTTINTYAHVLHINASSVDLREVSQPRAAGYSVRCVKMP